MIHTEISTPIHTAGDAGSEASTNALRTGLELRLQPMKEFETCAFPADLHLCPAACRGRRLFSLPAGEPPFFRYLSLAVLGGVLALTLLAYFATGRQEKGAWVRFGLYGAAMMICAASIWMEIVRPVLAAPSFSGFVDWLTRLKRL